MAEKTKVEVYVRPVFDRKTWKYIRTINDVKPEVWPVDKAKAHAFFCAYTKRWFCKETYNKVTCEGYTVCWECARIFLWKRDEQYHWWPEPNEKQDALRSALEKACKVEADAKPG